MSPAAVLRVVEPAAPAVEVLWPGAPSAEALAAAPTLPVFAPVAVDVAQALSRRLLATAGVQREPELVALAYWLRRANVTRIGRELNERLGPGIHQPRGTVFHIAPSNVDTIFVYSWALSMLAGNANIVRLPSARSPRVALLSEAIAAVLAEPAHAEVAERTLMLRYAVNDEVTQAYSALCDMRVIWGGDETVRQVRRLPIPAHATELTFAGKGSLAVVGAEGWLGQGEAERQAQARAFFADAWAFGQLACSSPRHVFWVGTPATVEAARADFWPRVEALVARDAAAADAIAQVDKRVAQDALALRCAATHPPTGDLRLRRSWLEVAALHDDLHCGGGLFFEARLPDLHALRPLLTRRVQTLAHAGLSNDTLRELLAAPGLRGIDRAVPFGQALAFSEFWDGHDLPRAFLRQITLA